MRAGDSDAAPTAAVLLAAGSGTRLGRGPKALLSNADGFLVEQLARTLAAGGCSEVIVVLGHSADEVVAVADLSGCQVVVNEDWPTGLGSSLKRGVDAVAPGSNVLVALVDQPGVSAELVKRLLRCHRAGRITAAGFRVDAGWRHSPLLRKHPVVFDAHLARAAAESATGDAGARGFLLSRPHLIDVIDCSDLGDGRDIDVTADLELLG